MLRDELLERLAGALTEYGLVEHKPGDPVDLVIRKGKKISHAIVFNASRDGRRSALEGMLADAFLRAHAYCQVSKAAPVAVVGAPRMTPQMISALRQYADRYAPGAGFGVVDSDGTVEVHGAGIEVLRRPSVSPVARPGRPTDLFSDLNQWLLKVLLGDRLEARWLDTRIGLGRAPALRTAAQLASVAGVSVPTAARLVAEARAQGFVEDISGSLHLVQIERLFERWKAVAMAQPPRAVKARWLIPNKSPEGQLAAALGAYEDGPGSPARQSGEGFYRWSGKPACLGLFAAARALGFRWVLGAPQHLYVGGVDAAVLDALGVTQAEEWQSHDLVLLVPRNPEAVFRAAVHLEVMTCDLIQCWLDASAHPARGAELADHIWERGLAPHLLRREI